MSEDPTKDIKQKYDKPTIETVLERINELGDDMRVQFKELRDDMQVRLGRVESVVNATRPEFLTLRADFTELKRELREHLPTLKS